MLADQFVTFGSCDGANFTVQGNCVFQTVNRALPAPLLGYAGGLHHSADRGRTTQNIISLNFGRNSEIHLNFSKVTLTQTIVSKIFWEAKIGLIAQPKLFGQANAWKFNLAFQMFQNLVLGSFVQLPTQGIEGPPGYGETLSLAATPRLKIHMAASRHTLPFDLIATYAGTVTSANMSNIFSFGLHHQLNNRLELFADLAFFDLANIAATLHSFGMNNAR